MKVKTREQAAEELETVRHWIPAQQLAYMKQLKEKHQASETNGKE